MTERDATGGVRRPARLGRHRWATLAVLTVSVFVIVLDTTVVSVALPTILKDVGGTLDEATWVQAGSILPFAVFLLVYAKLGDVYGRRVLFVLGMTVFTLVSLGWTVAPSVEVLVQGAVAVVAAVAVFLVYSGRPMLRPRMVQGKRPDKRRRND